MEPYAWHKLLDSKLSNKEKADLYDEGIRKLATATHLPQLFRVIFKDTRFPFSAPDTIALFINEINRFDYHNSEELGNSYESLLAILGSQKEAGQFRTPRHIIDFIVQIVQPQKDHRILDPACGTAGFLISAYIYITEHQQLNLKEKLDLANQIHGVEIDPVMAKIARVNLYLHGFKTPSILENDTLTNEELWGKKYDCILANPPFMTPKGGIRPHDKFGIQAKRSEVLFVDYIAEHLKIGGRAGVIVPEGIIFQSQNAYKQLRRQLIENYGLFGVISLPPGVFQPYSAVKTSILLIDRAFAKITDKILFVKINNDGFDLGAQRRAIEANDLPTALDMIREWQKEQNVPQSKLAWTLKKNKILADEDCNLSGERYKEVKNRTGKWPLVELGEVCEIESGSRQKGGAISRGIPSIGGEQISADGSIKLEKMKYISEEHYLQMKKGILKNGDVLIVKDGATTGKTAFFNNQFLRAAINEHVFILRAKESVLPFYFYQIIYSSYFQNKLKKYIKGIIGGISLEIKKIKIPLPPLEVQQEIVAEIEGYQKVINGAKAVVKNYCSHISIDPDWEVIELEKVCERIFAGGDVPKSNFSKVKTDIYQTPIFSNGIKDKGLYGYTDIEKVKTPSITISARGTIGHPEIRKKPFYPVIRLIVTAPKKDKLLLNFLYYAIKQSIIGNTGNTIPQLTVPMVKKIKIPMPPLETQQAIVAEIEQEQKLVNANQKLIALMEQKITSTINKVWEQEETSPSNAQK